jgi:hypothetical protein
MNLLLVAGSLHEEYLRRGRPGLCVAGREIEWIAQAIGIARARWEFDLWEAIHANPVRRGPVAKPEHWRWSGAA